MNESDKEKIQFCKNALQVVAKQYHELLICLCKGESMMTDIERFYGMLNDDLNINTEDVEKMFDAAKNVIIKGNHLYIAMQELNIQSRRAELNWDYRNFCDPLKVYDENRRIPVPTERDEPIISDDEFLNNFMEL